MRLQPLLTGTHREVASDLPFAPQQPTCLLLWHACRQILTEFRGEYCGTTFNFAKLNKQPGRGGLTIYLFLLPLTLVAPFFWYKRPLGLCVCVCICTKIKREIFVTFSSPLEYEVLHLKENVFMTADEENPTWDVSERTKELTTSGNPDEQCITPASICTRQWPVCFPELKWEPGASVGRKSWVWSPTDLGV